MFKTFDLFGQREFDDLVPEIVYYYLFEGLSLTKIELKLLKTNEYKGWLSKAFLNYYGIDTHKDNRGIFRGIPISEVINSLSRSCVVSHVRVARILKSKYG